MTRILTVMVATAGLVVFGAQNWENVPVHLIFGPPTRIRVIFLILISAGVGYVVALLRRMRHEVKLRAEIRTLRKQLKALDEAQRAASVVELEDGSIEETPRLRAEGA
jgi:uncharacterized integral membrane protein